MIATIPGFIFHIGNKKFFLILILSEELGSWRAVTTIMKRVSTAGLKESGNFTKKMSVAPESLP